MSAAIHVLEVRIGTMVAGFLSKAGAIHRFFVAPDYLHRANRPVLSQQFVGDSEAETQLRLASASGAHTIAFGRLPAFFANLLPEGPLRGRIIGRRAIAPEYEFDLLAATGANLPGDITVAPAHEAPYEVVQWNEQATRQRVIVATMEPPDVSAFSLAGSHDKVLLTERDGEFISSPAGGGDWIAKVPRASEPLAAANEWTAMMLAAAVGVTTAETRRIPIQLVDLPTNCATNCATNRDTNSALSDDVLVTRRFDRVGAGSIHVEDFAQVLGRYPNEKYSVAENYETLARILNAISARSSDDALEFTRRLVVSILIGNSAFHLKNIALIYPDGRTPILAPAFDLTAAIQYASDDRLALAIAGERDVRHITEDTFIAYARLADLPPKAVIRCVRDTVRQAYASWPRILFAAPMDTDTKRRVLARLAQLPLASRH